MAEYALFKYASLLLVWFFLFGRVFTNPLLVPTPVPTTLIQSRAVEDGPDLACTYVAPSPPTIVSEGCRCGSSFYPLTSIPGNSLPARSSCAYTRLPSTGSSIISTEVKAVTTATTKYGPKATVEVGSSPVHVGDLTGKALSTSISHALSSLCPTPTKNGAQQSCSTGTIKIGGIRYIEDGILKNKGEIDVTVESSSYNETTLRNAMINSAALSAMQSAQGDKNCYTAKYNVKRSDDTEESWAASLFHRASDLVRRRRSKTLCNSANFAGVQYFGPHWHDHAEPGADDWIDASWHFHKPPGGGFDCAFLGQLIDALVVLAPEFAVDDIVLSEAVVAVCEAGKDLHNHLSDITGH